MEIEDANMNANDDDEYYLFKQEELYEQSLPTMKVSYILPIMKRHQVMVCFSGNSTARQAL